VRSPHAHADIDLVDLDAALAVPGVISVLTGAELAADGVGGLPCVAPVENRDGSAMGLPRYPVLAIDRVRHVGEAVAAVVAETLDAARDGAERVEVRYAPLPAVVDTAAALDDGAPVLWPSEAPGNLSFDWEVGDAAAVESGFRAASHVAEIKVVNNRVAPSSIEPRSAIGEFSEDDGRYTLRTGSQSSHMLRDTLAAPVLGVPTEKLRVVSPDVGGGFGTKIFPYPEHGVVLWTAKKLGRAIKWTADRSQVFVADAQARDHVTTAELALDQDGKFLAMRVSVVANMGAYLQAFGPFIPTASAGLHGSPYAIPAVHVRVRGVHTNTVPVDAYRGAGKPEATYATERLVDAAARVTGIPRDELRRRNFVSADQMPYTSATGIEIDGGDFAATFEKCLALADWEGFEQRRAGAEARGKLRGLGFGTYVEMSHGLAPEFARIEVEPEGLLRVHVGIQSNGQGHETAFAQLVSERLGVPFASVRLIYGDSDALPGGGGSMGSRSLISGGSALHIAGDDLIDNGRKLASDHLEAAVEDIEYSAGDFIVRGTDRSISLFDLAQTSPTRLVGDGHFEDIPITFPNGVHVCEVEIDPETGHVSIEKFTVVNDFGKVMNPLLVEGQVQGGVGQGIGQALLEHCAYDPATGQLITGSFLDYALPRADDLPPIVVDRTEIPCSTNMMGSKGVGEAGATGSPPAVVNAVVDGLAARGVTHVDMPLWPQKIWRARRAPE
jgi:carbon-monoxide dehydrogenase large subunit